MIVALDSSINKVLIIGSGPIIIGQAAEFDYSGTQACKAIKEEGIKTVLVNSNPATIMTDENIADSVYIEPLTIESIEKIIQKEMPDGILAGFGGQTALNLSMELLESGVLQKYGVELLGINEMAIKKAEDREEFKKLMIEIDEPIPQSIIATNTQECIDFAKEIGYPVIVRPAYTLGGTGGGIAKGESELIEICKKGFENSPIKQLLLEQSVAGWKEVEYEVIRDKNDNCIIICNMENFDPVGVHTGDSIVIAPSQTLSDKEYQMLRSSAIKIIRSLAIEGGCNIQFALDPYSKDYIVIEVNPRVSRSSALASKAAGYPIAKISAKLALGYTLDELKNYVTKDSSAFFEPALDYVVVKIPKWPFDKFKSAKRTLGTQMKATGEVMSIGRTFESAFLKGISCLEGKYIGMRIPYIMDMDDNQLEEKILQCDDERAFALTESIRRGNSVEYLNEITGIDPWFLNGLKNIADMEKKLSSENMDEKLIHAAEDMGFTDCEISQLSGMDISEIDNVRKSFAIKPVYKMVDTCSAEFEAKTPYYYSCYEEEDDNVISEKEKIIVIGSGPIRIGQGIEFDYCCVHGVWAINDAGYESIMVNNNPETVSTDFDTADKLYFESLYIDDVMNIIEKEKPQGVIVQLGGQTSLNLAKKLHQRGVKLLGTSFESLDLAEDRNKFAKMLKELEIPVPTGGMVSSVMGAVELANRLSYPVIVRPSYVTGGRAMQVIYDDISLERYMNEALSLSDESIILDKYVKGVEIELDAIADGENVLIPGIMQHIEKTGVHSGDSISVYPCLNVSDDVIEKLVDYTEKIVKEMNVVGLLNIQYAYDGSDVYVIEVNPRASRTVPILSKVTGIPMVKMAVGAMLGKGIDEFGYGKGLVKPKDFYAVKFPVFSGEKLSDVDMYLGPEMKSTGEILGLDEDFKKAAYKGFVAAGFKMPKSKRLFVSVADIHKEEAAEVISEYAKRGFEIFASGGTAVALEKASIEHKVLSNEEALDYVFDSKIDVAINIPTKGNEFGTFGFKLRRKLSEHKVPMFTSIDTARLFMDAMDIADSADVVDYRTMSEYLNMGK